MVQMLNYSIAKKVHLLPWLLLLFSFILLSGCATKSHRDGPPSFHVDETKVADATPKAEPLAKYGNMPSYRVYGKRYYVMKSAKNYHERGTASWYGMKFHKQRTSSGEPYNVAAMTAAHRTLPLPTYVEVTNLANNKKVIVKVNDRGPFASNRILDLSYVAAKKLGMVGHGTANVDVKAITPGEAASQPNLWAKKREIAPLFEGKSSTPKTYAAASPTVKKSDPLYLQVGAFKNRQYAENLRKKIMPMTSSSKVQITHTAQAKSGFYRVKIGPFTNVAQANQMSQKLRDMGLQPRDA